MNVKEMKKNIIQAGYEAVKQLVKVAKEPIVETGDDISADRLKNAAATKKLAIFDAFEILSRIEDEKGILENKPKEEIENTFGLDASFHTCSAFDMTADDLIAFLDARGKFMIVEEGFTTDQSKICNH